MPNTVPDAIGVLHYNGFTFPATTTVEPHRTTLISQDGNTYKGSAFEITATCLVSCEDTYESMGPDTTIDALITYLRKTFSKVSGKFLFARWGYGTICLNEAVAITDKIPPSSEANVRTAETYAVTHVPIDTSPIVHLEECDFTGYNKSVRLKVKFEFELFDSNDQAAWTNDNRKITEMYFSRSWTTNQAGYVTRITRGGVRYWTKFESGGSIIDNDYSFINQSVVPVLPAYQRESSFTPDNDNRGFTFQITDIPEESPLPYPVPMRKLKMVHSIGSGLTQNQNYFNIWNISFNLDVEVMQDAAKADCIPLIGQLVLERMQKLLGGQTTDGLSLTAKPFDNRHLLMGMRISDEVTSNRFSMDLDWRAIFSLDKLLSMSKILSRPAASPINNWNAWTAIMGGIQGNSAPYLDLKTVFRPVNASGSNQTRSNVYDRYNLPITPPISNYEFSYPGRGILGAYGAPYTNYLKWKANYRHETDTLNFGAPCGFIQSTVPYKKRDGNDASGGHSPPGTGLGTPSFNTYKAGPTQSKIVTFGEAERAGAFPAVPTMMTYDGVELPEIGKSAVQIGLYMTSGGIPVYTIAWYLVYQLGSEVMAGVNPFTKLRMTLTEPQVFEEAQ